MPTPTPALDDYVETLPRSRVDVIIARCARRLGVDVADIDVVDVEAADAAWNAVVHDMWATDVLEQLVEHDVLVRDGIDETGRLRYRTA